VTGEFHDLIVVVFLFNVGDVNFHGRNGAWEDCDCFHVGVSQVARVKVACCHIGLELLTPIEVYTRCDAGIEDPLPQFGVSNVAIHLPNLYSIVSVTQSDTWVRVFFDLPRARVFDGRLKVRALGHVSVHKKVRNECHILQCESCSFRDYLCSLLSGATGDSTQQSLSSFSALSVCPVGLPSRASKANGNIKIAYEYIYVVYLLSLLHLLFP